MTYQTVDTETLIRKIESHTAIKLIEQIFPSHPLIGGIEVAFVIKLFSVSAKLPMKAGSDGLLVEAAKQLLLSYYPKPSRLYLNWTSEDFRCFATALADDLASRTGTKKYAAHWIADECTAIITNFDSLYQDRNLAKFEQFNGEVNEVEDVVWLNRVMNYTNRMKTFDEYKNYFPLLNLSIIVLRVHNALDQYVFDR
tara:strand:+ start:4650 stop:5240 length:591 start_codon:yes stop_codon:yes gene_type:complete